MRGRRVAGTPRPVVPTRPEGPCDPGEGNSDDSEPSDVRPASRDLAVSRASPRGAGRKPKRLRATREAAPGPQAGMHATQSHPPRRRTPRLPRYPSSSNLEAARKRAFGRFTRVRSARADSPSSETVRDDSVTIRQNQGSIVVDPDSSKHSKSKAPLILNMREVRRARKVGRPVASRLARGRSWAPGLGP